MVHRNHYAELEENRGIALRPLISELASNLRGSAPESARRLDINLDLESLNTTQDVAVATAFLTTEIVEHAMLTQPEEPVTLSSNRSASSQAGGGAFGIGKPVLLAPSSSAFRQQGTQGQPQGSNWGLAAHQKALAEGKMQQESQQESGLFGKISDMVFGW